MAATAEKEWQMNLAALQQRDPYISSIRDSASQVAVYTFNANLNEWVRLKFLLYRICLLNAEDIRPAVSVVR